MFDNMSIIKGYKLQDNITGGYIEIATFNANLIKDSNINVYMNINYPNLYDKHKEEILVAYREFNAEITSLACTMGLSDKLEDYPSKLNDLEPIKEEFKNMAVQVFEQVINSLGDVQVNPVPSMDISRY